MFGRKKPADGLAPDVQEQLLQAIAPIKPNQTGPIISRIAWLLSETNEPFLTSESRAELEAAKAKFEDFDRQVDAYLALIRSGNVDLTELDQFMNLLTAETSATSSHLEAAGVDVAAAIMIKAAVRASGGDASN